MQFNRSGAALFVLVFLPLVSGCLRDPGKVKSNRPMVNYDTSGVESEAWDTPPKLKSGRAPIYPASALLKGTPGTAVVSHCIEVDGTTSDAKVAESSGPHFGDHSLIAVKEWIYEPARKDGQAVRACVLTPFEFAGK